VDDKLGNAKWIADKETLEVTVPIAGGAQKVMYG
jgi:hypothetical protein